MIIEVVRVRLGDQSKARTVVDFGRSEMLGTRPLMGWLTKHSLERPDDLTQFFDRSKQR